jgi:diguanylate cyclase (GGDEF)-like protein
LRFILSNPCFLPQLDLRGARDEVARSGENLPENPRTSDARTGEPAEAVSVSWSSQRRHLLFLAAAAGGVGVFLLFALFERPGLGLGHLYYLPIALLALAAGARAGAVAGVVAAVLYTIDLWVNPHVVSVDPIEPTAIRLLSFVAIGTLVGWFASSNRRLVDELQILAERDTLTGLPNTRAFERAIGRRLDEKRSFTLLIGDLDALSRINDEQGVLAGDETLRRLAELLGRGLGDADEIARVGSDEFALVTVSAEDPARLAGRLERRLGDEGCAITFGWACFPREGENALALYRAANERLYVRKLARGRRNDEAEPALRLVGRSTT